MVTGDNKLTAFAVAKDCNIIPNTYNTIEELPIYTIMEGKDF